MLDFSLCRDRRRLKRTLLSVLGAARKGDSSYIIAACSYAPVSKGIKLIPNKQE